MFMTTCITRNIKGAGPCIVQVTEVPPPCGVSVNSAWLCASKGFRKSSLIKTFRGPRVPLSAAAFTADPDVIVTATRDRTTSHVATWSIATGTATELGTQNKEIETLIAAPDGKTVFSAGKDSQVVRWTVGDRKAFDVLRRRVDRPYAVAFLPPTKRTDGKQDGVRMVVGYAGWGAGQLDVELAQGAWLMAPVEPDLIFETAFDKMWETAIRRLGAEPSMLHGSSGVH